MRYRVIYSPDAQQHLANIFRWIADQGAPEEAEGFVLSIHEHCESLSTFPHRGTARDDLVPGMRTLGFKRRVLIAYVVIDSTVEIHGIYYGGRNYETLIRN